MKTVKIMQELIKNYDTYVKKHRSRDTEALPSFYYITDGKVYIVFPTHVFAFDECDMLVDLEKFTELKDFRRDKIKRLQLECSEVNANSTGTIKIFSKYGKNIQCVELRNNDGVVTYVDKKIFDYYEATSFYFEEKTSLVYVMSSGKCIGMILPVVFEED